MLESKKYTFIGRIEPSTLSLTLDPFECTYTDDKGSARLTFFISGGRFSITAQTSDWTEEHCRAKSIETIDRHVASFMFSEARYFDVVFEWGIKEGDATPLGFGDKGIREHFQSLCEDKKFDERLSELCHDQLELSFAVIDLLRAIRTSNYSFIAAARAVEAIRNLVAQGLGKDQAWEKLRNELQLSEVYLREITDASRGPRHGNRLVAETSQESEMMKRAWTVVYRYVQWHFSNARPLPEKDFATL